MKPNISKRILYAIVLVTIFPAFVVLYTICYGIDLIIYKYDERKRKWVEK